MLRILAVLLAASFLGSCDSNSETPKPPPPAPESEDSEPLEPLEDLRETDYKTVDEERAAEMLKNTRLGEASGGRDASDGGESSGISVESIPHSGLRGPIGPFEDAAVILTDDGSGGPNAVGVYMIRRKDGAWIADYVGPLGGPWRVREVDDLFMADAHDDGDIDVFVVARFTTGAGTAAAKQFGATIPYVWREGQFRYPNRLDDALTDAASEERALEILRLDGIIER